MLLGSVGQPSTSRYELGSWVCLGYWLCWVCAATPNMATAVSTATKVAVVRVEIVIANYLLRRQYTPEVLPRSTDCSHADGGASVRPVCLNRTSGSRKNKKAHPFTAAERR